MSPSASVSDTQAWTLLNGLAGLRDRIEESYFPRTKGLQQLKNDSRKIDYQLRRFLFELLQVLEELNFLDDATSEDAVEEAVEQLPALCALLESQVNMAIKPSNNPGNSIYPNLNALVQYYSTLPGSSARVRLLSHSRKLSSDGVPALLLVNRANSAATVKLLQTLNTILSGLALRPVSRTLRGLSNVSSLDQPNDNITLYLRKVIATFHAISSEFVRCQQAHTDVHRLLFHLPRLNPDGLSTVDDLQPGIGLFLKPRGLGWQEIKVELLSVRDVSLYRGSSLCLEVDTAFRMGTNLVVHVDYNGGSHNYAACRALIPIAPVGTRRAFNASPVPGRTLRELLEADCFPPPSVGIDHESPDDMSWAERRSLAIKLFAGILTSFEALSTSAQRYHVIEAWDSAKVYMMEVSNNERHVSCNVLEIIPSGGGITLLPNIPSLDETPRHPSQALTILAKTLLEICYGPSWDHVDVSPHADFLEAWKTLNAVIDKRISRTLDIYTRPLLEAARACLDFHIHFETDFIAARQRTTLVDSGAVARATFMRLGIQTLLAAELPPLDMTQEPAIPAVLLFDDAESWGQGSREAVWAKKFIAKHVTFRKAYEGLKEISYDPQVPSRSRQQVRAAVIDTGFDKRHGSLRSIKPEHCWSWVNQSVDVNDRDGHGTYCAHFFRQVAPDAQLYIAQTFSDKQVKLEEAKTIEKAIRHAVDVWKVDIISMSFGLQEPSSAAERIEWNSIVDDIKKAIIYAADKHVLMFVAASNDGKNGIRTFPATMSQVICIHAADGNANDGGINPPAEKRHYNFATLGVAIPSPRFHADGLAYKTGTSFATPIAAGTAAVMLDFARRTRCLNANARNGLRTLEGMQEMFDLMSRADGTSGNYLYVAPWELWTENWEVKPEISSEIMSKVNNKFTALARRSVLPEDTI